MAKESLPNSSSSTKTCSVDGCLDKYYCHGMCQFHYLRVRHGRDLYAPRRVVQLGPIRRLCSVPECNVRASTRGWCEPHYRIWYVHGDPLARTLRNISDTDRFFLKVDKALGHGPTGDCWLWSGALLGDGYGCATFGGKAMQAHRVSFFIHNGHWPEPSCLHSCDVKACVNPEHLRAGNARDNALDALERRALNPHIRLSNEAVLFIRASDESKEVLAEKFNISTSYVSRIRTMRARMYTVPSDSREDIKL